MKPGPLTAERKATHGDWEDTAQLTGAPSSGRCITWVAAESGAWTLGRSRRLT